MEEIVYNLTKKQFEVIINDYCIDILKVVSFNIKDIFAVEDYSTDFVITGLKYSYRENDQYVGKIEFNIILNSNGSFLILMDHLFDSSLSIHTNIYSHRILMTRFHQNYLKN